MSNLFAFLIPVSFIALIVGLIKPALVVRWGEKRGRKQVLKYYGLSFILFTVLTAVTAPDTEQEIANNSQKAEEVIATVQKVEQINKDLLKFYGKLDLEIVNNTIIATIDSNVPDGGVFEITIMNGNFETLNDSVVIKNGKVLKEFIIPEEWGIGYLSGMAFFRFNSEENPQPIEIREVYGEYGENMLGDNTIENHEGENGKNGEIDIVTIAYPDEETIEKEIDKLLITALNELIATSQGVIIKIQPHFEDSDWSSVAVTLSDAWYYLQEYEKERFAEQYADVIEKIIKNTGKVKSDEFVTVYYFDQYQKELAAPKVFGGYNIK